MIAFLLSVLAFISFLFINLTTCIIFAIISLYLTKNLKTDNHKFTKFAIIISVITLIISFILIFYRIIDNSLKDDEHPKILNIFDQYIDSK